MEFIEELRFLKEQLKFKESVKLPKNFDTVVISGMGGSGIVGMIFQELYSEKPVFLVNDYEIPNFVSKSTLFIAISYSGNTEETLTATKAAIKRGAHVVTISAGGLLAQYGDQHIRIPRGDLQPRSATGYMLMPLLRGFGLVKESEIKESYSLLSALDNDHRECLNHARSIAKSNAIPVIYGSRPFKSVAYRWKTQFNENSKVIGYSSHFPELNHNDTLALAKTYKKKGFYFFVFDSGDKRIKRRIDVTREITNSDFNIIKIKGTNTIPRLFYLIHYCDYISYGLGNLRGVNPAEIVLLERLKQMIKK